MARAVDGWRRQWTDGEGSGWMAMGRAPWIEEDRCRRVWTVEVDGWRRLGINDAAWMDVDS